jgi:hypothetical protein
VHSLYIGREGDPGYLTVSNSEVAGYTGKKEPVGWWSILVGAERGGGKGREARLPEGRYQEVSDVEEPGWPCGVFLREQMRGFHDLLRQNPASLFMLFRWSSISMASMMMQSR